MVRKIVASVSSETEGAKDLLGQARVGIENVQDAELFSLTPLG